MDNHKMPVMLPPIYENIPLEMRERRQWVNWRLQEVEKPRPDGKKYTKIPLNPVAGGKASTTRPWTWGSLVTAKDRHVRYSAQEGRGAVQGAGYVLGKGEVGIDLDHCRDPLTGAIEPWAEEIISRIDSYTEISPSGTGIRIVCKGALPPGARRRGAVEMYDCSSPRYLTITGHRVDGTPRGLQSRQGEIEEVHLRYLGKEVEKATSAAPAADVAVECADDLELVDILEVATHAKHGPKFAKLWAGNWEDDYPSQSEADLALCSILGFYCGPQPDLIDSVFRRSGLMRDKWERVDYRERILGKAIDKDQFYDWGRVDDAAVESIVKAVPLSSSNLLDDREGTTGAKDNGCDVQGVPASSPDENKQLYETSKAKKAEQRRRRIYTIDQLAAMPPPKWQIRGIFQQRSLVILWGQPNAGKSFLALDWGLSTATGTPWLGREVHQGAVVYIAAEGVSGIAKRCLRWCDYHKMESPRNFGIIPEAFALIQNDELKSLAESIRDQMAERPALIVIDTLNRNLGGSESSEDDMGAFIRAAELLQRAFDSTILIIHHTGWNVERERGHSSLRGAADTMVSVNKAGERITDGLEIACVKQKDSDTFPKITVACVQIGTGDGASIVLTEEIDVGVLTTERLQQEEDALLAQVLVHLPHDAHPGMRIDEVADLSHLTEYRCRGLLNRAYNAGYAGRVGLGTKGSAWTFHLTDHGRQVLNIEAARGLLGS